MGNTVPYYLFDYGNTKNTNLNILRKIPMDGCRITFGLWPHVIQHPSIGIFPYCVNKQGITNGIKYSIYFSMTVDISNAQNGTKYDKGLTELETIKNGIA